MRMLSPGQPVRVVLAVVTALLVSGAAVFLARASSTHPRAAAQVHPASQASPAKRRASVTQAASRTQAAAGTQTGSARQAVSAE
jgi:hypothetical protein